MLLGSEVRTLGVAVKVLCNFKPTPATKYHSILLIMLVGYRGAESAKIVGREAFNSVADV
jgi:hypothetical protein